MSYLFAFIAETTLVKSSDLYIMARAIEKAAQACALVWGKEPPAIDVFEKRTALPEFCQPVVFIDDSTDPGALADHYWDPVRLQPAARVWANRASGGLFTGPASQSVAASHEVLEALGDPSCLDELPCPGREGVSIALELCDPVQDSYVVETPNGEVSVANYVLPAFFDPVLADPESAKTFRSTGGLFDALGTLFCAGQIGPSGYAILSDATDTWLEGPNGPFQLAANSSKRHPWARTARRLEQREMARRKVNADG